MQGQELTEPTRVTPGVSPSGSQAAPPPPQASTGPAVVTVESLQEQLSAMHAQLAALREEGVAQRATASALTRRLIIVSSSPTCEWVRTSTPVEAHRLQFMERSSLRSVGDHVLGHSVHWVSPLAALPSRRADDSGPTDLRVDPSLPFTPLKVDSKVELAAAEFHRLQLFPILHSSLPSSGLPVFDLAEYYTAWSGFSALNAAFCDVLTGLLRPGDSVVVDEALMLLPALLRQALAPTPERLPTIVYAMCESPFPSHELWRCLPHRGELLRGALAADLIVVPSFDSARNLVSAVQRVLGLEARTSWVDVGGRFAAISLLPLGVDAATFAWSNPSVQQAASLLTPALTSAAPQRYVVTIDRLDASRGLPQKLLAFEELLRAHPEHVGRVCFVIVVTPEAGEEGRSSAASLFGSAQVPLFEGEEEAPPLQVGAAASLSSASAFAYASQRRSLHQLAGRISGKFASATWLPVRLLTARLTSAERSALYSHAAVGFQCSAREGVTREALEYVSSQKPENPGRLLYSSFACGAQSLRTGAAVVNPYDVNSVAAALHEALTMSEGGRRDAHASAMAYVRHTQSSAWAQRLLLQMEAVTSAARERKAAAPLPLETLVKAYDAAAGGDGAVPARRLLVLSYNGTCRPFTARLNEASASPRLRLVLARLAADPANAVWVVTGDLSAARLHAYLGDLPLGLASESGYLYRTPPPDAAAIATALLPKLRRDAAPRGLSINAEGRETPLSSPTSSVVVLLPQSGALTPPHEGWAGPEPRQWRLLGDDLTAWPQGQSTTEEAAPSSPSASAWLSWYGPVKEVLDFYVERTPGSTLMASDVTLLWSWAGAQPDSEFGDAVARDVLAHLDSLLYGQNAEVLPSRCRRYLLVRPVCLSKGALLARGLTPTQPFFTLIAGSDRDDEEMMAFARGEGGWAIAVGACAPPYGADSGAPWMLPNPDALLDTLEALVG